MWRRRWRILLAGRRRRRSVVLAEQWRRRRVVLTGRRRRRRRVALALSLAAIAGLPRREPPQPPPPITRARSGQVPNEDVERKFQHLASSIHKMGMVLDSVQNDLMQLNRAMKEALLDSGSIQQKVVLLDNSLQQILEGQDDLKALLKGSTKSNPDQLSVLNSHTSKLNEISLILSVLPKQVQASHDVKNV